MSEQKYKPAWRSYYWHILAMVACLVLVSMVSAKAGLTAGYQKGLWIFFLLFIICAAGDMILRRSKVALIVKPDEITLEQGLIGRHSIEISTKSIRTIQVRQSVLQRMLNVGDILIASAGTDGYEISAINMPDPHVIRDAMQVHERAAEDSAKPTSE